MAVEVYPVVHIQTSEQALEQVGVALEAGADGVYLIDHHTPDPEVLTGVFARVKAQYPDQYIGLNFLQLCSGFDAFGYLQKAHHEGSLQDYPDGIWVDNALADRDKLVALREFDVSLQSIRYLGGMAFKYTREYTDDPIDAARQALGMLPYVDVVCTSGPGTNIAPGVDKIWAMKQAIAPAPLAVASGIGADNFAEYSGQIDQILVASSIETEPYSGIFDKAKLQAFLEAIKESD